MLSASPQDMHRDTPTDITFIMEPSVVHIHRPRSAHRSDAAGAHGLSEREELILRAIVQSYVLSANPVSSAALMKQLESDLKVSSATIRNVMAHLEERGYINHPHVSAGRVPTDLGYRYYVDSLMAPEALSQSEASSLKANLSAGTTEVLLRDASRLLGVVSRLLGVVQLPTVGDLTIRRIELVSLSSTRLLVVVAFDSDVLRTVTLETDSDIAPESLDAVSRVMNERVSGKPLRFVRENFPQMLDDHRSNPVVRLFVDSLDRLLHDQSDRLHLAGAQNLVQQPEFDTPDRLRGVVELMENEDVIVHLMERSGMDASSEGVRVMIGSEIQSDLLRDFSFVSAQYRIGARSYSVGLIGPKRMNYAKLMSLVGSVAHLITSSARHDEYSR